MSINVRIVNPCQKAEKFPATKPDNMLSDAPGLEKLRLELLKVKDALGGPGASERVADIAFGILYDAG